MKQEADVAVLADGDIAVVVPGILGSSLERENRQVWGYRQIGYNLFRLAEKLTQDLSLPPDAFDSPDVAFDTDVKATSVLSSCHLIPGFWSVDGYRAMVRSLRSRYAVQDIFTFPYDWRQSNRVSARRLGEFILPLLHRRRRTHPRARAVLIGHSMGGLVARYYAACLDADHNTRRVVTIGTPYLGSVKALLVLARGTISLGPYTLDLANFARSLPSVAELLPIYPCVWSPDGEFGTIESHVVPGLPAHLTAHAIAFQRDIRDGMRRHGSQAPKFHAVVGHLQPTDVWVSTESGLQAYQPGDLADRGDGTVARRSATPPEWESDAAATFLPGKHASIHQQRETLRHLHGILTARPHVPMAVEDEIAVTALQYAVTDHVWEIRAESCNGVDTLAIEVVVTDDTGQQLCAPIPLRPTGNLQYRAFWRPTTSGVFRWEVRPMAHAATPLEPISDLVLVGPPEKSGKGRPAAIAPSRR
ncbi:MULTISPECIES: esterase/lipase family protein [unclassified Streptomyces]|uniref:esterase/lipase family protein n=1 Tax=unclassified Streptomyces TaxID=2593676 RepID=UPI00382CFDA7